MYTSNKTTYTLILIGIHDCTQYKIQILSKNMKMSVNKLKNINLARKNRLMAYRIKHLGISFGLFVKKIGICWFVLDRDPSTKECSYSQLNQDHKCVLTAKFVRFV
jgi:hypothetical protein